MWRNVAYLANSCSVMRLELGPAGNGALSGAGVGVMTGVTWGRATCQPSEPQQSPTWRAQPRSVVAGTNALSHSTLTRPAYLHSFNYCDLLLPVQSERHVPARAAVASHVAGPPLSFPPVNNGEIPPIWGRNWVTDIRAAPPRNPVRERFNKGRPGAAVSSSLIRWTKPCRPNASWSLSFRRLRVPGSCSSIEISWAEA